MSDDIDNQNDFNTEREFLFTEDNFRKICQMIYDHAGITLKPFKHHMVYSRLARRLRATGVNNFSDYLKILERNDESEFEAFVNSLTTNLTSFFREPHHFPLLAEHISKIKGRHTPALWCSAASTGEEAYSMAITLAESFGSFTPNVSIIATDVDTNVLATADAGIYAIERVEKLPEATVKRFFLRGAGDRSGFVRVRPELRDMITFKQVNLLADQWPIRGPLDAIFCRNVMIYFDKSTQLQILERFSHLLHPDGLVFAGHSESFHHAPHLFRSRGRTVYELLQPFAGTLNTSAGAIRRQNTS